MRRAGALTVVAVLSTMLAVVPAAEGATGPVITADGIVHAGMYSDVFFDSGFFDDLAAFSGKRATFAGRFHDVFENADLAEPDIPGKFNNTIVMLNEAWAAEATPFSNVVVGGATAADIAGGGHDDDIRAWAGYVQRWLGGERLDGDTSTPTENRSLIIAPLQEMNGDWTGYGCDAAKFKTAYRRFVDIFRDEFGLDETKVRWSFAPNGWTPPGCGKIIDYYPGHDYVDVVGISAYNFGTVFGFGWESVPSVMGGVFTELRTFVPAKPYLMAQTASCPEGGDQGQWAKEMMQFTAADPNAVGFVWFNLAPSPKECDYHIFDEGMGESGWKDGMQLSSTTHVWPLTQWFQAGSLIVAGAAPTPDPCPDALDCDSISLVDAGARFHLYDAVTDGATTSSFYYGNPGDYPLMGDWDCNGTETPGQYRQTDGYVYLRNANTQGVADIRFFFGDPGDVPLVGDFDGDGCDTVSIYRPSQARVFIINALGQNDGGLGGADLDYYFGNPGDKPFVGDFDGDGIDTVGLHRESTGLVYFRQTHTAGIADDQFIFGDPGDKLVAGDWNGDGVDSPALFRPTTGRIYVKLDNAAGNADVDFFAGFGFTDVLIAPGE